MTANPGHRSSDDGSEIEYRWKTPLWVWAVGGLMGAMSLACLFGIFFSEPTVDSPVSEPVFADGSQARPVAVHTDGYAGSQSCKECHQQQHASWHDSFHRTMTQVASSESILGDFDQVELELDGRHFRLGNDGQSHWFTLDNPRVNEDVAADTNLEEGVRRNIVLCTGSHHMQLYWFSTGKERQLAAFPFAWLIGQQRWIPQRMTFLMPPVVNSQNPTEEVHAFFQVSQWSNACIKCHATHGQPWMDDHLPKTQVAEFGISCEACHGPGQEHVRQRSQPTDTGEDDPIVLPLHLDHQRSSAVCGQCHSVFDFPQSEMPRVMTQGPRYRPGDDLHAHREFAGKSDVTRFWGDGMVRVVGREFSGLTRSPCYINGEMSCFSCHEMHQKFDDTRPREAWTDDQLKPNMRGDEGCLQCHQDYREATKVAQHTHHLTSSEGSRCYNCHMPNTTYGLLKATRSHQVGSPSIDETLTAGRPNACNLCHLDKSLKWSGQHLEQWYGQPHITLTDETAESVRLALSGDAGQRALIAWHFGWEASREASGDDWIAPYLAYLLADDYAAVRLVAEQSLRNIGEYNDLSYDVLAAPAELQRVRDQLIDRWNQRADKSSAPNSGLLISADGSLEIPMVERLLRLRDHRPVFLAE